MSFHAHTSRATYTAVALLFLCLGPASAADLATARQNMAAELRDTADKRRAIQQRLSEALRHPKYNPDDPLTPPFLPIANELKQFDTEKMQRLEEWVAQAGWPSADELGEDAVNATWYLVVGADVSLQSHLLPVLQTAASAGRAKLGDVARLEDCISANRATPQRYGTYILRGGPRKSLVLFVVDDPENLDARRASVGLPPIDEYLKAMEIRFGERIERSNLPAVTTK